MRPLIVVFLLFATTSLASERPWEDMPYSLWDRDFSTSTHDDHVPLPTSPLGAEGLGTKKRIADTFDLWLFDPSRRFTRWNSHYADVTLECKGKIELEFALTLDEWRDPVRRRNYHREVFKLINRVGTTLLNDFGNELPVEEEAALRNTFLILAWQESSWQHYLRHKNWFFVVASGGSFNELEDWGISQVARSKGKAENLLNERFFARKGYCSIGRTLYYGFMEYYLTYKAARLQACNAEDVATKLLGAYNMYATGFSLCHNEFSSDDQKFHDYQKRALGGFTKRISEKPWLQLMQ